MLPRQLPSTPSCQSFFTCFYRSPVTQIFCSTNVFRLSLPRWPSPPPRALSFAAVKWITELFSVCTKPWPAPSVCCHYSFHRAAANPLSYSRKRSMRDKCDRARHEWRDRSIFDHLRHSVKTVLVVLPVHLFSDIFSLYFFFRFFFNLTDRNERQARGHVATLNQIKFHRLYGSRSSGAVSNRSVDARRLRDLCWPH